MDKIYLRKVIKLAFAVPLAYSLMLVLDIDINSDFLGLLLVYMSIWLFPDPIGLKRIIMLKLLWIIFLFVLAGGFTAALWGINSIVIFIFALLTGFALLAWMPSAITTGNLCNGMYLGLLTLNSPKPFTQGAYYFIVIALGMAVGWSVDRLFWPIFDQQGIERQVSQTFRILKELNDCAFHPTDISSTAKYISPSILASQADNSIRATNKALKISAMTGSLSPLDRDKWTEAIALQARLMAHMKAISQFLQDHRENALLSEIDPELSALGSSLSANFAELSVAMVFQKSAVQLSNPSFDFQHLQSRLTSMRETGIGKSFDLPSRLAIGLIERGLERLVTDLLEMERWQEIRRSNVP